MTKYLPTVTAALRTVKSALGLQRPPAPVPRATPFAPPVDRLSATLGEIATSLVTLRQQIDELHGRR